MFCINCYYPDTKVTNSRPHKKQPSIWRRRRCQACGLTFTTLESPDISGILHVRNAKTGAVETYEKGVLLISILTALHSAGGRPGDAYWLTETVEQHALSYLRDHQGTVKHIGTDTLRDLAYETLSAYHQVAGLSYGAAHGLIAGGSQKRRPGRPRKL